MFSPLDNTLCVQAWKYPDVNNVQVGKFCGLQKLAQEINRHTKAVKDRVIRHAVTSAVEKITTLLLHNRRLAAKA